MFYLQTPTWALSLLVNGERAATCSGRAIGARLQTGCQTHGTTTYLETTHPFQGRSDQEILQQMHSQHHLLAKLRLTGHVRRRMSCDYRQKFRARDHHVELAQKLTLEHALGHQLACNSSHVHLLYDSTF